MNILETVLNSQGGAAVEQLGAQFGLPPEKTQSALAALVPALAAGVQRNVSSEGGLQSLLSALTTGGHERYLEDPTLLAEPETTQDGNGILGHLFGSKEVSRQVAQRASDRTGIGTETLKRMLPIVATMVMGGLARQTGGPTDTVDAPAKAGGIMAMLSPLLDQNRDGSMVDDVLGMAGRFFGGRTTT
jgi:hypothetical protein